MALSNRALLQPAAGRLPYAFRPVGPAVRPVQPRFVATAAAAIDELELEEQMMAARTQVVQIKREKQRSRRFRDMLNKVPKRVVENEPAEAVRRMKSTASTKFTESVEVRRGNSMAECNAIFGSQ